MLLVAVTVVGGAVFVLIVRGGGGEFGFHFRSNEKYMQKEDRKCGNRKESHLYVLFMLFDCSKHDKMRRSKENDRHEENSTKIAEKKCEHFDGDGSGVCK